MLLKGASRVIDENGALDEHCFQIGDEPRDARRAIEVELHKEVDAQLAAKARAETASRAGAYQGGPAKPAVASDAAMTTRQLLAQLRARLRVVDREIKVRKTLEAERDQIRRLISAAEADKNNVRRMRAAG